MTVKNHSEVVKGSRHAPHNLQYASAGDREAGTNEASSITVTSANEYQVARQVDDDSFWILLDVGPPLVWVRLLDASVTANIGGEDLLLTIADGGWAKYHSTPFSLSDDAEFNLPGCGFGTFTAGNAIHPSNSECIHAKWDSNGTVFDLGSSTNTAFTDSDTNFCCYDAGSVARIKNRLGGTRVIIFDINFYVPIVV